MSRDRLSRLLLGIGGGLMLASSIPHALLGWPPAAEQLRGAGVDAGLVAGLAVGWHFGSAAMAALGAVVLLSLPHVARTGWAWRIPLCVGLVYVSFGLAATAYRALNPHFLVFIGIGALLVAGASLGRGRKEAADLRPDATT